MDRTNRNEDKPPRNESQQNPPTQDGGLKTIISCDKKRNTNRYVYFISGGKPPKIKIGTAYDPWKRLKVLQIGSPVPLKIVGLMAGDESDESRLHALWENHRSHGEWFHQVPEITRFLDDLFNGSRHTVVTSVT